MEYTFTIKTISTKLLKLSSVAYWEEILSEMGEDADVATLLDTMTQSANAGSEIEEAEKEEEVPLQLGERHPVTKDGRHCPQEALVFCGIRGRKVKLEDLESLDCMVVEIDAMF
ncbi:hypothetical protein GN244_ATG19408 [Phytophthora infestans]|uniref:Uncharacterized protein n=1 Tax=Phytophthora infestans TaxID=4787 RepID=A0A833RYL6_PHYIN|nr:hypothetical protein GN244_ATG19408 [Phytophthora infestans]KAF4150667.1 hypothetical protein GN958_ATG00140 [Phytophthora infestans]